MNNQHQSNNLDFDNRGNSQTLNNILNDIKERKQFKGHQDCFWSKSFSPDGKTIASASDNNTARFWPVRNLDR
ncbi:WD40 repeat domain-containing protein [Trichormus azollae]|uniref:WD40 repeat domain-containing protein n=1 Tax=Trichormus azollae TaxID=1164 RepID=UPI00325E6723